VTRGDGNLLDRLRSRDAAIQAPAIVEAEKTHAYEAAPIIAELLRSPDDAIRSSAAEALGYVGIKAPGRYSEALLPLLDDSVVLVRSCAAESLGALAYEPAIPRLGRLLVSDSDKLVRASAAEALAAFDDSRVLSIAERALDDPDPSVRAYAVRVIGLKGDHTLLPRLKQRLDAEEALQPRAALLGARYLLGSKEDLDLLLDLLRDADVEESTIVLNAIWGVVEAAPAASLVRDGAAIRNALAAAKKRDAVVGRHADKVVKELAKRLGASSK
jgi:HEAT repeat protein